MPAEDVEAYNKRRKQAYGYNLSLFSLMWPHILGRIRKEIEAKPWFTVPLNRCGSWIEGGLSPTTKSWSMGPGVTATAGWRGVA